MFDRPSHPARRSLQLQRALTIAVQLGVVVLSNGLAFAYYDSTGAVTAVPNRVARVDITLRAQTAQQIRARTGSNSLVRMVDSLLTSVALRNNRRY